MTLATIVVLALGAWLTTTVLRRRRAVELPA
jgi:hypothetical protein